MHAAAAAPALCVPVPSSLHPTRASAPLPSTAPTPQFHRNVEYPVQRPVLRLSQVLHAATRLIVTASADPVLPEEGEEEDEAALAAAAAAQR